MDYYLFRTKQNGTIKIIKRENSFCVMKNDFVLHSCDTEMEAAEKFTKIKEIQKEEQQLI